MKGRREYRLTKEQGASVVEREQQSFRQRGRRIITAIIFFIFIISSTRIFLQQQRQLKLLKAQKQELERSIADVLNRISEMEEELLLLDDPAYIETIARQEYGMVGEGDLVFIPAKKKTE